MAGTRVAVRGGRTDPVAPPISLYTMAVGVMDEDEIARQLHEPSFDRRTDILEQLRAASRRNAGRLPFPNKGAIFDALAQTLADSNWHVRNQSIQLLHELVPQFGDELDDCMGLVLNRLVMCVGDSNVSIRRAAIQTLHVYMKHTNDVAAVLRAVVANGLENSETRVRKEVTIALPVLCTPDFSRVDFYDVTQALAKRLLDAGDQSLQSHALLSLEKIRGLVGEQTFVSYIHRLSSPLRRYYFKLTDHPEDEHEPKSNGHFPKAAPKATGQYKFGVVPSHVMDKLTDQSNFRSRAQAVEELKQTVGEMPDPAVLLPHVPEFLQFLTHLLDDSNFKITTVTLEILGLLVQRLGRGSEPHLKPMTGALAKRMGDNKIVVRQAIMKDVMQLMQALTPRTVLGAVLDNLSHRNSRVRQETLNICIASLLTFPSYDFDLGEICQRIAHTLVDPKRQVRQASLECFAYLAQAMGPGKMQPLVQAVDSVELSSEGDGCMAAVQARLARRQLPRLSVDGLVDYAILIPASASSARGSGPSTPQGADLDWILSAAGGSGSSARSSRNEVMELESVTSSARSTPVHHDGGSSANNSSSHGPSPRRHLSAGKSRNRLPWEETAEQNGSAAQLAKTRGLWTQEEANQENASPSRKPRSHQKVPPAPNPREPSPPEQGSYRQIHLSKYKRCSSSETNTMPAQPFTMHNAVGRLDADEGWNYPASLNNTPRNTAPAEVRMFSQSWSDPQMFEDAGKPKLRAFLDPISAPESDWQELNEDRRGGSKVDSSPIPTKATLARGASSKKKVPPIAGSRSEKSSTSDYYDDDSNNYETSREEMNHSLKSIRSSANKKKADAQSDTRSPSPDSGKSSIRSDDTRKKSKKSDTPFETKPRLARKPSQRSEASPQAASLSSPSMPQMEFQPRGGVTFTQNRSSDVAIVGKGYHDEAHQSDPRPSQHAMKAKEKRRQNSKGVLSPLGMANPYGYGAMDIDDDHLPGGVVGRRMFDVAGYGNSGVNAAEANINRNRRASRDTIESKDNLPKGVYGYSVRQNSSEKGPDDEDFSDPEEAISMAPTTKEALHRKKQEELIRKKEEEEAEKKRKEAAAEKRRQEAERKKQEAEQRRQKEAEQRQQEEELRQRERERQQDKLKRLSYVDSQVEALAISGSSQPTQNNSMNTRNTASKPSNQPKKKFQPSAEKPVSGESAELEPFKDPQKAFDEAMRLVSNEQWDVKCNGIEHIRRITRHHPEVISQSQPLHTLNLALINEVKNLRSQVSRSAIVALGDMYSALGRVVETDLDQTVKCLVVKYSDSNSFIHEELDKTLRNMVDNLTPQRCMCALVNGGAGHKSAAVRRATSLFLVPVIERMGPGRVLSGIKEVTDKILPTAVNFLLDGSPETRYNGQRILAMLMHHEDFDRMMTKHIPANTLRNVQDKLENLKKKGLGDPPSEPGSAKTHRSGRERSNNSIRGNSASSTVSGSNNANTQAAPTLSKRPSAMRTDEATMETIASFCQQMKANNWQERQAGINQLVSMAESRPSAVCSNVTKIFDSFIPCLKDSNSKTNLHALQMMIRLTPVLSDHMGSVVNMLVQNLSVNLSSKNKDIYDTASNALDELMSHTDPQQLIQPMVQQAQAGSARIKPDMVERVSYLTMVLSQQGARTKTLRMHVLPLIWHLLNTVPTSGTVPGQSGSLRMAVSHLASALHSALGDELYKAAKENSKVTPRMIQFLQELVDNPE